MALLTLDAIKDELLSGDLTSMHVLVRPSKWSGRGQVPAVLFISKHAVFYGGSEATKNRYHRISFKSISCVKIVGKLFMKSLEVEYLSVAGVKRIYFCPFTGDPHQPSIDVKMLHELQKILQKSVK